MTGAQQYPSSGQQFPSGQGIAAGNQQYPSGQGVAQQYPSNAQQFPSGQGIATNNQQSPSGQGLATVGQQYPNPSGAQQFPSNAQSGQGIATGAQVTSYPSGAGFNGPTQLTPSGQYTQYPNQGGIIPSGKSLKNQLNLRGSENTGTFSYFIYLGAPQTVYPQLVGSQAAQGDYYI